MFVSEQGQGQPHTHVKARVLSKPQLENGLTIIMNKNNQVSRVQ